MKGRKFIWAFVAAAVLAVGCTIEPFLHLRQAIRVIVNVLWKAEVYPDGIKPTGVTMYLFRDKGFYKRQTTASVDSCTVKLEPGNYKLYMISQSPEEFGYMEFLNMDSFDSARVSLLQTKSKWFSKAEGDYLAGNPEMMTVGISDNFEISAELIEELMQSLAETETSNEDSTVRSYTIRVPVNPKSIVSQYWITIYSENADLLKGVRASTSGMARSFLLTKNTTGDDECIQIITDWKLTIDDPISRVGHLDGWVATFGFPRGELPSPDRNAELNITTLLADNITEDSYVFTVGNAITLEEATDGYRHRYRLVLGTVEAPAMHPPNVRPEEDESGLNALVEDWGEGESVDVGM